MRLSQLSKYLDIMYTDRMTISRYIDVELEDGSIKEVLDYKSKLKDIPCRISTIKEDEHNLRQQYENRELVKFKVFCSIDTEIFKGDFITLERIIDGKCVDIIKAIAGKPIKYDIDQEFVLIENKQV
ncbi:hypothetical protein [Paraclostridium sordellii]|uniref:hypothetical protein n=1 Tax=Paraclostridium sordellii TaxID=1505 RepID=UPI0005E5950B|nr:hypothetical protein [Paeniclostridium sordellii]MDU6247309.1 hypothetical protein [Paeniclostridium sordellii]MRZ79673.1 hypothetical protein [Paeniclostridium sordellii]MSB57719.1 hypothetical protein [Paeniclostridium sordellii]MVO70953.1 hypothetical protein [Paeniclostridium sordellii]CEO27136.1 Uncharacterised protein [[Clostridium] sordellii] [Paeniclostridium sordellii]